MKWWVKNPCLVFGSPRYETLPADWQFSVGFLSFPTKVLGQ